MVRWAYLVAAFAFLTAGVAVRADENPHVSFVPWRVLAPGATSDAPLTLFWIPASPDELRRSELLTSDELTMFATRCVAMRVVRVDDQAMLASLEIEEALPVAVLADKDGHVLGRVKSEGGELSVSDVEALVRDELDERAAAAEMLLDDAAERAERGEDDEAIALYESVCRQRCECPRQARDAERALKKLRRK